MNLTLLGVRSNVMCFPFPEPGAPNVCCTKRSSSALASSLKMGTDWNGEVERQWPRVQGAAHDAIEGVTVLAIPSRQEKPTRCGKLLPV